MSELQARKNTHAKTMLQSVSDRPTSATLFLFAPFSRFVRLARKKNKPAANAARYAALGRCFFSRGGGSSSCACWCSFVVCGVCVFFWGCLSCWLSALFVSVVPRLPSVRCCVPSRARSSRLAVRRLRRSSRLVSRLGRRRLVSCGGSGRLVRSCVRCVVRFRVRRLVLLLGGRLVCLLVRCVGLPCVRRFVPFRRFAAVRGLVRFAGLAAFFKLLFAVGGFALGGFFLFCVGTWTKRARNCPKQRVMIRLTVSSREQASAGFRGFARSFRVRPKFARSPLKSITGYK